MKVRWTRESVRFRITPAELEALQTGAAVAETLALGPEGWRAVLQAGPESSLTFQAGVLTVTLSETDRTRLAEPEIEGVYGRSPAPSAVRFAVEKDFPCAHPRPAEANEPPTETFAPPNGFTERKPR